MWSGIWATVKAVGAFLGIVRSEQKKAERREYREQGERDAALESERQKTDEALQREKRRGEAGRLTADELDRKLRGDPPD